MTLFLKNHVQQGFIQMILSIKAWHCWKISNIWSDAPLGQDQWFRVRRQWGYELCWPSFVDMKEFC